jgi:hypothetical protein
LKVAGAAMMIAAFLAVGARIPAGTQLAARLTTPVSSKASKVNDLVQAVVVSPIAAGHILKGHIRAIKPASGNENAFIDVEFEGAHLIEVDNARESVDESGRIVGITASHSPAAQIDLGIEKINEHYGKVAEVLQTFKTLLVRDVDPEIEYGAGVEIRVELDRPLPVEPVQGGYGIAKPPDLILEDLVRRQPVRAQAERPALPSDWTNIVFIGTRDNIVKAFKAAGWSPAAEMNTASVLEAARAIIEARGYQETPVSKLRLDGLLPDMVFQKMNNTLAKRHHLRIWRTQEKWHGQEVWIGAATHDNGIAFAPDERTFFHTIEPDIDRERDKVADDLMFTGLAKRVAIVGRPGIPTESTNATGDRMVTDGQIAVLSVG